MSSRLTFVAVAATSALRRNAFPADEPLEPPALAKAAAARGALRRVDRAWASPALRAQQTALALGLDAAADPALGDGDYGRWRGRSLAELAAEEPDAVAAWLGDPAAAPHGGESVLDLVRRIASWLEGREKAAGQTIVITHPAIIRAAVVHALAADPKSFWRIDIEPLSRTSLTGNKGIWTLRALGCPLVPPGARDPESDG